VSIKAVVTKTEDNPNYVWYKPWEPKLKTYKFEYDLDEVTLTTSDEGDKWKHTITGTEQQYMPIYNKKLDSDTL